MIKQILISLVFCIPASQVFSSEALDQLLDDYQALAESPLNAQRGAEFWQMKSPDGVSCSSCHGVDLRKDGKHLRTGKLIAPMSTDVNPERLTDINTVQKWLYRNCKSVWSRECGAQEKGDVLLWLKQYK